jgi:hypothetical protein
MVIALPAIVPPHVESIVVSHPVVGEVSLIVTVVAPVYSNVLLGLVGSTRENVPLGLEMLKPNSVPSSTSASLIIVRKFIGV